MISYAIHKSQNTLFMGCDYYIEKRLCVIFNDNSCDCVNLSKERGYYDDFNMDINSENINFTEWQKIQKYHLTPNESPFIIYTNHSYVDGFVANRYEAMVEYFVRLFICKNMGDIKDIVIYEERYER